MLWGNRMTIYIYIYIKTTDGFVCLHFHWIKQKITWSQLMPTRVFVLPWNWARKHWVETIYIYIYISERSSWICPCRSIQGMRRRLKKKKKMMIFQEVINPVMMVILMKMVSIAALAISWTMNMHWHSVHSQRPIRTIKDDWRLLRVHIYIYI